MRNTHWFMFAISLLIAACASDGNDSDTKPLSVVEWATEMAQASQPDTIQDKFDVVVDTDDPSAFDGVIEIAKEQAAAEAAAGD